MDTSILRKLNARPIAYYPVYRQLTGSLPGAVLLSQLMYWFSKQDKLYKTDKDIQKETGLTDNELRSAKLKIKSIPFITVTREGIPARTFYKIDWEFYAECLKDSDSLNSRNKIPKNSRTQFSEIHESITETTTEITKQRKNLSKDKLGDKSPRRKKRKTSPFAKTYRTKKIKNKYRLTVKDLQNYSELQSCGATKHRKGTKAEKETLDKLHALFSAQCKVPYVLAECPNKYYSYSWTLEEVSSVFEYQLANAEKYGVAVIKNIGNFIFTNGYKNNKAWSPLVYWHRKMNREAENSLDSEGSLFLQSLLRQGFSQTSLATLESKIINTVGKNFLSKNCLYSFLDGSTRNNSYPYGAIDVFSKYIKLKMNSANFKIIYIIGGNFIDEFFDYACTKNILVRNSSC